MNVMRLSIFAHHVGEIVAGEGKFTLSACPGVNADVTITPNESGWGKVWDHVNINGTYCGNRKGGVEHFTKMVCDAKPEIIPD